MWTVINANVDGSTVGTTWNYDAADPFTITIFFNGCSSLSGEPEVIWEIDRDQLGEALKSKGAQVGVGDVKWTIVDYIATLSIQSPEGVADILFTKAVVEKFFWDTLDIVAQGSETVDIDSCIEKILEGAF
jgi:hypothetical protein